ncbi:TPA: hypothetical protein ACKRRT_006061, partial [Pseudomonas aeruginosa]
LNHAAAESLLKEIKDCRAAGGCGEEKLQGILGKYEKLSAERSNAIGQCASRQCVDDIVDSSIRMDDPVSKELLSLLRQTTYDTPGLLQGNPDAIVSQTPNPSGWGDLFALDKQLAFAKNLKEGWLTPEETADLDRWNASTSWLDRTAGRQLDPKEKAYLLSELGGAAAMALLGGRGSVGAGSTGSVPNITERGTLVNLRPNDVAIAQRPVRTLEQDESGRYWLKTSTGKRITPSGSYDFVTMPDGSVRVARPNVNQDFSTHLGLSGGGEVKYAGSVRFGNNDGPSRGKITQWTNNSGHYQPPAALSSNAGLPQSLFNPR